MSQARYHIFFNRRDITLMESDYNSKDENDNMSQEDDSSDKKEKIKVKTQTYTDTCDLDLEELISFQRTKRNELILRFLSLLLVSFTFGLLIIQLNILWKSRQAIVMDMVAQDRRLLFYPKFYQVAHNEETWCWDPETLLLKVNTSIFVR